MLTLQQGFNVVWHYAKKKKKGMRSDGETLVCAYRGDCGPCFIGLFIADANYNKKFELKAATYLLNMYPKLIQLDDSNSDKLYDFVMQLQDIHDRASVEEWPNRLKNLAKAFRLSIPES